LAPSKCACSARRSTRSSRPSWRRSPQQGWGKIDVEKLAKDNGYDLGSIAQAQSSDPTQALDLLKSAADDVTEVGPAKVRGVDTTQYRATLDVGKALAADNRLDATAKANLGTLYNNLKAPADVWIDKQGRLRKMTYSFDVSKIDRRPSAATSVRPPACKHISAIEFNPRALRLRCAGQCVGGPRPTRSPTSAA